MGAIVTETITIVIGAIIIIILIHVIEKFSAESNQIRININRNNFIDKYSQKARHIKIHKRRHKIPDKLYFDSRRDLYIIDEDDQMDDDYIHYHWGRYRKPLKIIDFHHEVENKESYINDVIIDLSIMQSTKIHLLTEEYLIWLEISDRVFDSHFILTVVNRQNLKPIYSFYQKSYLPFLINFSSGSISSSSCTTYEAKYFNWYYMSFVKQGAFAQICYDTQMILIDDINIDNIGGWRIKVNLDANTTIFDINITRSHESLVSLLPIEESERNPSYDHKECGIKASVQASIDVKNTKDKKLFNTISDKKAIACYEFNKAVDFVKKKRGHLPAVHEQCISASISANVEHKEKHSSDDKDGKLFIITHAEIVGLFLCDGHLHNDTALLNGVWIEEHLHPLPQIEIIKIDNKLNTYLIQDINKTVNLEFRGEINNVMSHGSIGGNTRSKHNVQYDKSFYGFINGTINVFDHHHVKKIYFKKHVGIFDRIYDRVSWV
jgi:hypothetical protein